MKIYSKALFAPKNPSDSQDDDIDFNNKQKESKSEESIKDEKSIINQNRKAEKVLHAAETTRKP